MTARLDRVLSMRCCHCHKPVKEFVVVNCDGVQIWPLPTDFQPTRVRLHFSAEPVFTVSASILL